VNFPKSRKGSAEDRGRVLSFPAKEGGAAQAAPKRGFLNAMRKLGPGFVTGAADVDPSAVLTATVVGAAYHYGLLWVVILCVPFLLAIFSVAGRIGHETRKGLVDLLRINYGRKLALGCAAVIVLINLAMIVADLLAVSDALSIILRQPRAFFVAGVAFTVWYLLIFREYHRITRVLLLLSLPLYLYVMAALIAPPSPQAVLLGTVLPRVTRDPGYVEAVVALLGALLTPYIIVWQTGSRREAAITGALDEPHSEPHAGAFVTTLLCYSIIVAAGSVLHMSRPVDMTTAQAALALRPAVGPWGEVVFALGIIGSGLVALPVLVASLCYSVAESFGWRSGLTEHPWDARGFYVLISAMLLVASVIDFIPSLNPVKALYWSMILAGCLVVPILVFILVVANDRRIMRTANTVWQNFWIGAAAGCVVASGLAWAVWRA
jgi:Mn2+/Fe2+ NRAMP family transporter